jgi:hypothetical protein
MKIIIISVLASMALAQVFISKSTTQTEQRKYQVLKKYENFEIRKYEPALFSSVKLGKKSYSESSSEGFRILAGYIFGDNEKKEKISMTSPVTMELGDTSKMMFMVPKSHDMESLPDPSNSKIVFEKQSEKIVAAIRFDGWANDKKIEKYQSILKTALAKEKIAHNNKFAFLGYNPPYDLVNRRNEVIVELVNYK